MKPRTILPQSQEDIAEDAMQSVGKAARGVWDFLTSPDDKEFLRRVDARHGTNLGALHDQFLRGPGVSAPEASASTPPSPRELKEEGEAVDAGEVVIVIPNDDPDPECAFCKGKQVIALRGGTRTPMACPTCKKDPSKKPKSLSQSRVK